MIYVSEGGNEDEISDMELAKQVGDELCRSFPDHPWVIDVQGHGLVIRHLSIASEVARVLGREGFSSLLPREKLDTPKEVTRTAVEFGGQLLEAFSLPRGRWDGTLPIVPKAWTHGQERFH